MTFTPQKFKESVVQTDGNDSLNRNLTLVGHKLVSYMFEWKFKKVF